MYCPSGEYSGPSSNPSAVVSRVSALLLSGVIFAAAHLPNPSLTLLTFFAGVGFLALAFFSLLFALNHLNLSLVAPASASLTLVTNAIAGKIFLKENVDRRRWTAAVLVCVGVYLLAH